MLLTLEAGGAPWQEELIGRMIGEIDELLAGRLSLGRLVENTRGLLEGNCVATGIHDTGINQYQPMLATEQNGSWTQGTAVPLPPGVSQADSGGLDSIFCSAANVCVAVGGHVHSGGYPTQDGLIVTIRHG